MRDEDHDRFLRAWTQAQPAIAGYVAAVVQDAHAADDVLQNVAVAALRRFPEYDASRPFIAWAMGIAKIEILTARRDQGRTAARFRDATIDALAAAWEESLGETEARQQALGECLRQLVGRNRELVTLRYHQDLPLEEIAARLRMTSVAVRVALSRLRSALHSCIQRRLAAESPSHDL